MAVKRIRVREMVREVTLKTGASAKVQKVCKGLG
jgi:hypothetical protein